MRKKCFRNWAATALVAAVALASGPVNSPAVILKGTGDPEYNTTAPTGSLVNSGWQYQGLWGGVLGTAIAPQYFIAAKHAGGAIGHEFTYNGVTYHTVACWSDPSSDLCIWKVDGIFPFWAPLYSLNDEQGKSLVVIGRGTQRGDEVLTSQVETNYTTNIYNLKKLNLSRKAALKLYPTATIQGSHITIVSSAVTTNAVLKGWKAGPSDGRVRWGENQVISVGSFLSASFDVNGGPNEASLTGGDSSGAAFIQEGGVWKLAGINYGIEGPFATTMNEPEFYGAILDRGGLYSDGWFMPDDAQPYPACFYCTRISVRLPWIQSVIGQLP